MFERKNISIANFLKSFLQPPKFFKHQIWKLDKGLTVLTPSRTQRQVVKVASGRFPPYRPD